MRISQNLIYTPYQNDLQTIQSDIYNEQLRMATGKNLTSTSDDPNSAVKVKNYNNLISKNEQYQSNILNTINELQSAHESISTVSDDIYNIRNLAIDATQAGSQQSLNTLSNNIKGVLDDIISTMNQDYNGILIFGGTKTTIQSIKNDFPASKGLPFEIITNPPTTANPSGMEVQFYGNNKERVVNKDSSGTEVVNITAQEIFGTNGTKIFDSIINLYNLMKFDSNGIPRTSSAPFKGDDQKKLDQYQKEISDFIDTMNQSASVVGTKLNRLNNLSESMANQNTQLKAFRSEFDDTDFAETSMNLAKDQAVLQYSMQVGSKLMNLSLFNFI